MSALALPERVDLAAVGALHEALLPLCDANLTLDASKVTHLGGLGVQLLLSAALTARMRGHALAIADPSTAFTDALAQFGVTFDDVQNLQDTEAA